MNFEYQAKTFSAARRYLMLPYPGGEAESIANAFHQCSLGLLILDCDDLDDDVRDLVAQVKALMDTTGLDDSADLCNWTIKAEQLTLEQQSELSRSIDELANWFARN